MFCERFRLEVIDLKGFSFQINNRDTDRGLRSSIAVFNAAIFFCMETS